MKTKPMAWDNYSTGKERRNLKQIKTNIIKMKHHKTSKLLKDSSVSRFMTKLGRSKWFIRR